MESYMMLDPKDFEGTYTQAEVDLNNRIYAECMKDVLDTAAVEELLLLGADPLGATATTGYGLLEHIYAEIINNKALNANNFPNGTSLPQVTELFLKHGMKPEKPRIPYDDDNSLSPMYFLSLSLGEDILKTCQMLLDNGLSADGANEIWAQEIDDLILLGLGDPCQNQECPWAIKKLFLCASYDVILRNDENLRNFIGLSYNTYDLRRFRNWNDFSIEFDTSHCERCPAFYKSVITIRDTKTHAQVWKFGVHLDKSEFL